jgi:8-oxo-dGTP pyrophosphatase MutT (NUDIX family)
VNVRVAAAGQLVASGDLDVVRAHLRAVRASGLAATRDEMLRFADEHADALHHACAPGHFTGSALVVDPATRQTLLLHHTKLRKWLQPGGHADGEANLAAVALREATEETGIEGLTVVVPAIDLDIHVVEPPHEAAHRHLDVRFVVLAPPGAAVVPNHESTAWRWAGLEDLEGLGCDPGLRRLVAAALTVLDRVER